jgi:hypothetical protein
LLLSLRDCISCDSLRSVVSKFNSSPFTNLHVLYTGSYVFQVL